MNRDEIATLLQYYSDREQGGAGLDYFYTPYSIQKGAGVGSFLSGLYRSIFPLIRKSANYLAPHIMKTMGEVATDYATNPSTFQNSVKNHSLSALENVTSDAIKKMRGGRLGMVRKKTRSSLATIKKRTTKRKSIKTKTSTKKSSVKRKPSLRVTKRKTPAIEYPFFS